MWRKVSRRKAGEMQRGDGAVQGLEGVTAGYPTQGDECMQREEALTSGDLGKETKGQGRVG